MLALSCADRSTSCCAGSVGEEEPTHRTATHGIKHKTNPGRYALRMAAVQPIRGQSFETIHDLLRTSLFDRKPISATYNGKFRLLCPHVMGRNKDGVPYALCYQFGG